MSDKSEAKRLLRMLDEATDADGEIAGHREGKHMNDAPIPPDIRKAADAVVERGYDEGLLDAVCHALMAERERAAKIADEYDTGWTRFGPNIADAIRRGTP